MFISSQATRAGLWLNKQRTGYAMKDFVVKEKSPGRASNCLPKWNWSVSLSVISLPWQLQVQCLS